MAQTKLDIRQSETRALQDQLNSAATTGMDSTLASLNSEATAPGRLIAQATPTLVVNVNSGTVVNPNTLKNRVLPPFNNTVVNFAGGTITFPSTSGNITLSTGGSAAITIGANQFVAVMVQITSAGLLAAFVSAPAASIGALTVPLGTGTNLSLGYIIVQSNGSSVIQNVTNAMLYQFVGGGGSSSSSAGGGTADEVALTVGTITKTVVFITGQASTDYVVMAQIVNYTDTLPEFIPVTITNKTSSGFTATWNAPLPTGNYLLDYTVTPGITQQQSGEMLLGLGISTITITLPISLPSTAYVVVADMTNLVDSTPQFIPVLVTAKTTSTFTVRWNIPTDTANYRLAWQIAAYQ